MAHTIEILTVQEVADRLGVHKGTVNRWIASGLLLPWRPGGARRPALVLSQVAEQFQSARDESVDTAPTDQARAVLRAVRREVRSLTGDLDDPAVALRDVEAILRGIAGQYGIDDLDDEQ